jgi:hypothetical protein
MKLVGRLNKLSVDISWNRQRKEIAKEKDSVRAWVDNVQINYYYPFDLLKWVNGPRAKGV